MTIDKDHFYDLGRLAFPSSRYYPKRDTQSSENEQAYIAGWNDAKRLREMENQNREFEG